MPIEFFQVTAAYSNAMLVAVMPHFADFAKKLDLPTPQPVTIAQVQRFVCLNRSDFIGGRAVLTNGCEFVFLHGHVEDFVSPRSYFNLQDPNLVPKFYGALKISEAQAIKIARDAIKKLGYGGAMLASDRQPQITPPERYRGHHIARYRIQWRDPTRGGDPQNPPMSAEFEVDATSGQIVMVRIQNPNAYRPDLKLNVTPPVISEMPQGGIPVGPGRKITPVSPTYAKAFLKAILPQLSDFVRKANLPIKAPISENDVDMEQYLAKYSCGTIEGDTMAQIHLKTGDRFIYSHGQVTDFHAHDAMEDPERQRPYTYPGIDKEQAKYFGKINMTTNQAVDLIKKAVKQFGYSEKNLHMDKGPDIYDPGWWGTNRIARVVINWQAPFQEPTWVHAEVNLDSKTITSLCVNDHANTNIWREPPKIEFPK